MCNQRATATIKYGNENQQFEKIDNKCPYTDITEFPVCYVMLQ